MGSASQDLLDETLVTLTRIRRGLQLGRGSFNIDRELLESIERQLTLFGATLKSTISFDERVGSPERLRGYVQQIRGYELKKTP